MMELAAVVLAAGASTRMGRPKALLRWRGRPFVHHAVAQARAAGAGAVLVVEGAVPLPDEALDGAQRVRNEAWAEGPLGSLQVGLRGLLEQGVVESGVVVLTVDRPHVRPSTLRALAGAVGREPGGIWQPRYEGRRGHPIVYPADLLSTLVGLRSPDTPRTLLGRAEVVGRRREIEVDDGAVLDNLDRPEDLERLPV